MPRIELSTFIAAPIERCFDLARSVDFHTRSASATREHAVAGRITGLLGSGESVTWRARHFGLWQLLTVRITSYHRPEFFQDTMVHGTFQTLRHDHVFEAVAGGTVMRDDFEFTAPLGLLGQLAERLVLTAYMRAFIEHRNRQLKAAAESTTWREFLPPPNGDALLVPVHRDLDDSAGSSDHR